MKKTFHTLLILFFVVSVSAQQKFKVIDKPDHVIQQQKEYTNPNYDASNDHKTTDLGPVFGETYIDEPQAKTLAEYAKLYPFTKPYLPDGWPEKHDVKKATYKVVQFNDGTEIPVVQTPDGTIFTFLVEEGLMAFDIKHTFDRDGTEMIGYMTVEIEKTENGK